MDHGSGIKNPSEVKLGGFKAFLEQAADSPKPSWLIQDLIPTSGWVMVAGPPGSGKTWFALSVIKQAASLGRQVYFFEREGNLWALGNRMGNLMAMPVDSPIEVFFRTGFRLDERKFSEAITLEMKQHFNPVVVFDPLNAYWIGDENLAKDANRLIGWLDALLRIPSALVITLHHTAKGGFDEGRSAVYAVRGSSALPAAADYVLNVSKSPSEHGTMAMLVDPAKARDLEEPGKRKIVIALGSGQVSITSEWADRTRDMRKEVLRAIGDGCTSGNQVVLKLGARRTFVQKLISELVIEGLVVEQGGELVLPPES